MKNLLHNEKTFIRGTNMIFNKEKVLFNLKTCYPMQKLAIQRTNMLLKAETRVKKMLANF